MTGVVPVQQKKVQLKGDRHGTLAKKKGYDSRMIGMVPVHQKKRNNSRVTGMITLQKKDATHG